MPKDNPPKNGLDDFIFDFDPEFHRQELVAEDYIDFSNMSDSVETAKNNTDLTDTVPQPLDDVNIVVNNGFQDQVPEPEDDLSITKVKSPASGVIPRIRPSSVTTAEQAESFFVAEVRRRFRFNLYDNMIDPLERVEIEDALYDALEEINQTPPFTGYTMLSLVQRGSSS